MSNNIQYNAAVKYLEKNEFRIKQSNSKVLLFSLSIMGLFVFFYILKFLVAI